MIPGRLPFDVRQSLRELAALARVLFLRPQGATEILCGLLFILVFPIFVLLAIASTWGTEVSGESDSEEISDS